MRVGSNKNIPIDVRVIAATNADLVKSVQKGKFREDLFYRLSILPIHIPPLRERLEDIPLLAKRFIAKFNDEYGRNIVDISSEALKVLMEHGWPGNVRELENTIGRSIIYMNINERVINTIHLPHLHAGKIQNYDNCIVSVNEDITTLDNVLHKAESEYIENIYLKSNKNKTHTAKVLGISLRSLYYKMEKYGIT
mgnify:FL=1